MSRLATKLTVLVALLTGCTGTPDGIEPVDAFEVDRYLGKWYELARLDHRFERGLDAVTATYTVREDGGLNVVNRGYDTRSGQWREARGKAFFVSDESTAHLKVSFFGPFYGSYVVFDLGEDYDHALVTGNDRSYLWLLARTPEIPDDKLDRLLRRAASAGFETDDLILVNHAGD